MARPAVNLPSLAPLAPRLLSEQSSGCLLLFLGGGVTKTPLSLVKLFNEEFDPQFCLAIPWPLQSLLFDDGSENFCAICATLPFSHEVDENGLRTFEVAALNRVAANPGLNPVLWCSKLVGFLLIMWTGSFLKSLVTISICPALGKAYLGAKRDFEIWAFKLFLLWTRKSPLTLTSRI